MALVVDLSSPARATGAGTNGTNTITTGSFDPPAAALVACVNLNARPGGATGAMSNNGEALTWSTVGERSTDDGSGATIPGGFAGIYVAYLSAARTGMTVTFTGTSTAADVNQLNAPSLKLFVVTGADPGDQVGSSISGVSTTNNLTTTAFTTEADASLGLVAATEWNELGTPTSTDSNLEGVNVTGSYSAISGYKALGGLGNSITFNLDAGGTATAGWRYVAFELRAASDSGLQQASVQGVQFP